MWGLQVYYNNRYRFTNLDYAYNNGRIGNAKKRV